MTRMTTSEMTTYIEDYGVSGVTVLDEGLRRFSVQSNGKDAYTVVYRGSGDGDPDFMALWSCNCAAGRHGRDCKHVAAVSRAVDLLT